MKGQMKGNKVKARYGCCCGLVSTLAAGWALLKQSAGLGHPTGAAAVCSHTIAKGGAIVTAYAAGLGSARRCKAAAASCVAHARVAAVDAAISAQATSRGSGVSRTNSASSCSGRHQSTSIGSSLRAAAQISGNTGGNVCGNACCASTPCTR